MKFIYGDIVKHPSYGVGIVAQRAMAASGANELYTVVFCKVLRNNGVVRVLGSELSLIKRLEQSLPKEGDS
ncbi:MAG: hypothetical protein J6A19_08190 [Oscillospiraceae bacterium]|nr:hypothetical protein [Oscillospiraceae bacterium]